MLKLTHKIVYSITPAAEIQKFCNMLEELGVTKPIVDLFVLKLWGFTKIVGLYDSPFATYIVAGMLEEMVRLFALKKNKTAANDWELKEKHEFRTSDCWEKPAGFSNKQHPFRKKALEEFEEKYPDDDAWFNSPEYEEYKNNRPRHDSWTLDYDLYLIKDKYRVKRIRNDYVQTRKKEDELYKKRVIPKKNRDRFWTDVIKILTKTNKVDINLIDHVNFYLKKKQINRLKHMRRPRYWEEFIRFLQKENKKKNPKRKIYF